MNRTFIEAEFDLTRGGRKMIEQAIIDTGSTNSMVILNRICELLDEKFAGSTLDYQTERMNFRTTKDILQAIDTFMYHQIKKDTLVIKVS